MKRIVLFSTICLALVFAVNAAADADLQRVRGNFGMMYGVPVNNPAKTDTTYMLGGPGSLTGKFETAAGLPDWQGWTSADLTFSTVSFWSVTDESELVISGTRSLWCGTEYPEPGPIPVPGFGYGNNWSQAMYFQYTVANAAAPSNVIWSMKLQWESEVGYDFTYVQWNQGGQWFDLDIFDGNSVNHPSAPPNTWANLSYNFTVQPNEYVGPGNNVIQLRIRFASDGAWSDEDGLNATLRGACQVDDISVTVNGNVVNTEDFEDGTTGAWTQIFDDGVGDFAALYANLNDADPCAGNSTVQVAFIDDGVVVPGTGGTTCITWCYGPGGYIVNNTGGLAGPDFQIANIIISPALEWPANADNAYIEFNVYRHEELGSGTVWPGMFYWWGVRSVNTGNPADLEEAAWRNRNFVYYGGPNYIRSNFPVSDLMTPSRTHVQVGLQCTENNFGTWFGVDGTPAPYFDFVSFVAFAAAGPAISGRDIDWAQDNFPTNPEIDYTNLANNAVRFDMARNVALPAEQNNYPGDTILFTISSVRAGFDLVFPPTMHVTMKANPLFDGVRVLPAGFTQTGNVIEGVVDGLETFTRAGLLVPNIYNFDLPDDDFFFPGDVIHYYIRAEDTGGGASTLPGNLDSFGDFDHDLSFSSSFIVRALPTMFSATPGDQPTVLFWNDFANRGGENEWMFALKNIGYTESLNYDLYYTNGPSSGVGNGLGGRATEFHIQHYDVLLYTSGDLSAFTLSNGDFASDPGNDLAVVSAWLEDGKKAFMTGDDLIFNLNSVGPLGQSFVNRYFSVTFLQKNILALINNQTTPIVRAVPGNGVIERVPEWVAYGGCFGINTFDAYTVINATRLAEFTNPAGQSGVYPYAAGSRYINPQSNADVIVFPYDFNYIVNAPGFEAPPGYAGIPARAIILEDILETFGQEGGVIQDVAPDAVFAVSNFPNPFNPTTTIKLNLPRTGDVSLKVFNVRGELVRTLVDGQMEAGAHSVVWDGSTNNGNQAASGVYFYETRFGNEVKVNKMALVK